MQVKLNKKLINWYLQYGRSDLPWRQHINPYRVWISEIMLQQTQVSTVIPYFEKFLQQFPNIQLLAAALEDAVLHLWSGLGYYSRARNLHKTAKIIVDNFNGEFPQNFAELIKLPGIGRSTANAIIAISFQTRAAILDGNVKRILTRLYAIDGWPGTTKIEKQLWDIAENLAPEKQIDLYTQAIMDLGATVCTRSRPKCSLCPWQSNCLALKQGLQAKLPTRKPKNNLPEKAIYMLVIADESNKILLLKRPPVGIWGSLWSLPECTLEEDIVKYTKREFGIKVKNKIMLSAFRHTFSHIHLHITPVMLKISQKQPQIREYQDRHWYHPHSPVNIGLPAPIKRILTNIETTIGILS